MNDLMKVAIPVFEGRVAPVFDWCRRLALVEADGGGWPERREEDVSGVAPLQRADRLAELGVDVLVCGGISPGLASLVEARGIRTVPWVAGEAGEVLGEFIEGRLPSERFMMPGGGGRGCGRRHRHGRRGQGRRRSMR
jgi:predicted Fe-Mo cluster-binding NifX family protein